MMEGVRVLDASRKLLYTIGSIGETVTIGRDRKCGIALAIDAQGVSRIHGSLKWSAQDELTLYDNSTYGTVVNGKLVKGGCQTFRDGARIFVGDVELVIDFPHSQLEAASSSSSASEVSKQDLSSKRKGNSSNPTGSERKRSKLENRSNMCFSRQEELSSFFVKKSRKANDSEVNCITLAEDTPQSQMLGFVQSSTEQVVSFVNDSASPSCGPTPLLHHKPESFVAPNPHSTSSAVVRRKKQCIFDVNMQPPSYHSTVVFAEDTQDKVDSPRIKQLRTDVEFSKGNKDISCIQETCERTKKASSPCSTTFGKQVSALYTQSNKSKATDNTNAPHQKPARSVASKKTSIFDGNPSHSSSKKSEELVASDKNVANSMDEPGLTNILKLVSSGKRYDNVEDDINIVEENAIDITRVVAKLTELVHYVDIERRPVQAATVAQSRNISTNKCGNFKKFKKASQGRFNASLTSANIPCIIGGKDDLVDFRQLPHMF